MSITPDTPAAASQGEVQHGSNLSGNYCPLRVSSQCNSTITVACAEDAASPKSTVARHTNNRIVSPHNSQSEPSVPHQPRLHIVARATPLIVVLTLLLSSGKD